MLDVKRNLTTMTDFYELTMSAGYLDEGYVDKIAVFDMFFRRVPDGGGYAVMAGLQQFIDAVDHLKFTDEDITYLRSTKTFDEKFLNYLANFKLHCNIWAIEEGMPIFPQEPIVTVEGPAIECQLLETLLQDIREAGRDAMAEPDWSTAFYAADEKGDPAGALGSIAHKLADPQGKYVFQSDEARQAAVQATERIHAAVSAFIADSGKQTAYHGALAFSTLLFWMMAVLVGMVQGGIQALSRSYFGKLIPPERSNEFFGFFDIFGKFAAVIGPFLYSFFYILTGRASMGILSLMLLFLVGGCILVAGRKRLRATEAENGGRAG